MKLDFYCADLKNYFITDFDKDLYFGEFVIANNIITLDFLETNQYFRIVGSKFNDGVYKYDNKLTLVDETFSGAIWAMSVPPDFLAAVKEAEDYLTAHPTGIEFQSESFGGYSYTRNQGGKSTSTGFWFLPNTIAQKLNQYRRMRVI